MPEKQIKSAGKLLAGFLNEQQSRANTGGKLSKLS